MNIIDTITAFSQALDAERRAGRTVGLVPTMGALHEGHASLVERAAAECDVVAVTVFVNPLQFGAGEDLDRYPRDLEGDLAQCRDEDVDCVFTPSAAEMYPNGAPLTTVHVERLTADLCGRARPTHFDGVTTVVAKLFAIAGPCRAYFGRKDAQQLVVITRMATDLNFPIEVIGCPIVREPDGLAMSSRNAYLTTEQRDAARVLSRALTAAATAVAGGERSATAIAALVTDTIASEPLVELEYVEVRDAKELTSVERLDGVVLIALAARVGATRLIDNVELTVTGAELCNAR